MREAARALVARRLTLLDAQLTGQLFILGQRRTVLDAYALPMLRWANAKLSDGLTPYPNVRAHLERMLAEPGLADIIASEEAS